ncbi:MAG TPA: YbhB/YbcL family Raf kinase inhibitor-like protein [Caulobacteraceae bacterium]|nr:YbhB/YbcL family Raf kinase inhibitor-like protein [Caulobacteraceae bacterium]
MTLSKSAAGLIAAAALAASASAALAQSPPPPATEAGAGYLVYTLVPAKGGAKLTVTSPAFANGADIPYENTQYRGNVFPGLAWSAGPAGTKSYAVIMQDTDGVREGDAILHWTAYNIPATVTKLDAAMSGLPAGASYGPNIRGAAQAYMGPRTPPGPKHRYHLQVYALDTTLPADPAMTWGALKAALAGHVLASGEVVGLGSVDPTAPPPAPRPAG